VLEQLLGREANARLAGAADHLIEMIESPPSSKKLSRTDALQLEHVLPDRRDALLQVAGGAW
jgi:hypothetical protein